jgi:hypothetical protein
LSSPFAQFGFNGMVAFNTVVFVLTVLLGYAFLEKNKVPVWLQMLLPLVLLKAHDIANTLLGGLTEPLFNLSLMGALVLLQQQKYGWFALLVSLMPFMRSEGQLPLLIAIAILLYLKEFKFLPLLGTGFLLYAIAGIFVYDDFWWYFTKSPYAMSNDIYGKGTWDHYLLSYKNYLGNPGLYIFLLSIPCAVVGLLNKKLKDFEQWFFAYGVLFGVLFAHSYFWATGQNGSIGLTRVATQGVPVFITLSLSSLTIVSWHKHLVAKLAASVMAVGIAFALVTTKYYPKPVEPLDQQIVNAATFLKKQQLGNRKVYYHFPLLSFAFGENPFKEKKKLVYYTFNDLENDLKFVLKPGDLIVRDSHFGPVEMGLSKETISNHPHLHVIKEFISPKQLSDRYNETEGVVVLEYQPKLRNRAEIKDKTIPAHKEIEVNPSQEFMNVISYLPNQQGKTWKIELHLHPNSEGFALVYDNQRNGGYSLMDLKKEETFKGTFEIHSKKTKLYIWNPRKRKGKMTIESTLIP